MLDIAGFSEAILDLLTERQRIPNAVHANVRTKMAETGRQVDQVLMSLGLVEEGELINAIGAAMGMPVVMQPASAVVDHARFDRFDAEFWEERALMPVQSTGAKICLATSLPLSIENIREASFLLQEEVDVALCPAQPLRQAIRQLSDAEVSQSAEDIVENASEVSSSGAEDGATARGIEMLVADAVAAGASDIHLDASGNRLKARFRVDGILRPQGGLNSLDAQAVFARLKLIGGMNVTERRMPQDGSCRINHAGRAIELRLSTLPAQAGESMVCRVLDPKTTKRGWAELGFTPELAVNLRALIEQPHGLLVISGPTGSGKTTTLYTALRHLHDGTRKILTVEDPIEQTIDGVEQIQVNASLGLSFGRVLRTTLRHDPDVLMIGEIRDEETAEIACRAALVGRLVLATIHASTARLVRERFINLGVPEYLIDEVLLGVLSQRLRANRCAQCRGTGCSDCQDSGLSGRKPEAELWVPG